MRLRSVLGWIVQVLASLFILSMTVILMVAVVIPRIAGATPYTILTGSMQPGLPLGSLVVIRPVDPREIGVNALTGEERQMAVYIVAALLLGYAAFMFTGTIRDRVRMRKETVST